jgi:hypothetical protein
MKLTTATTWQTEASNQCSVFAWGQALFAELGRVWVQLDTEDTIAYEGVLATQVHVIEDATASQGLLCQGF